MRLKNISFVVLAFLSGCQGLTHSESVYCGAKLSNNDWSRINGNSDNSVVAAEFARSILGDEGNFQDLYSIAELYFEGGQWGGAVVFYEKARAVAELHLCGEADEYFGVRYAQALFEAGEINRALSELLKVEGWVCANSVKRIEIVDGNRLFFQDNDVRVFAERLRARLNESWPDNVSPDIQCAEQKKD